MNQKAIMERRASERCAVDEAVLVRLFHVFKGREKEMEAVHVDFGEMGLGLKLTEYIPVGTAVKGTIKTEGIEKSFDGVVRWVLEGDLEKTYKVGIQLIREVQEERRLKQDRRAGPWFNRRSTNRREKEFVIDHFVFLSDTNLVGNTYFAKHFEWQGHVREAFLFNRVDFPALAKQGVKLITKEASCEYVSESTLGDPILLVVKVGQVTYARLELLFSFTHKITGRMISRGRQVIVFSGPKGKPIRIPDMIMQGIAPYR